MTTTTEYTFDKGYAAHTLGGMIATIPDQVYEDQEAFDRREIPVRLRGETRRATLRGDLYGLLETGTGDPVVEIID